MTVARPRPTTTHASTPETIGGPFRPDAIPPELRAKKRFTAWRSVDRGEPKPAKVPYSPKTLKKASSTAPSDWAPFDDALAYARVAHLDGVMRAFDPDDGMVGIDFDNCRDPDSGELTERVAAYVKRLDTYCEVSPSGTGVKLWAYGSLPPHGRKRGDVEMYDRGRFFTLTGQHLEGTPATVAYRPDAIAAIHREVFGDAPAAMAADRDGPVPALELGDEEILRLADQSPHNGPRFRRLWAGDTSDYAADGNDGASEADGALCEMLAYYGGPDPDRITRLFSRSGLYREKWDRADYQDRTIRLALKRKTRFYGDGVRPSPKAVGSDGASGCACESCPAVAEVGRLRRLTLDKDDLVEYQQAVIRTQRATIERQNRAKYAERELRRTKLTGSQVDAAINIIRIGTQRANYFDTDAPIITGKQLAEESAIHESTARANAEAVCTLPGSPITRVTKSLGAKKRVTTYELASRDPVEMIEQMVVVARAIDAPTSARPRPVRCPKHPRARIDVFTQRECSRCGSVLASDFPNAKPQCVEVTRIEDTTVVVPVPTYVHVPRIAGTPDSDELADRRAQGAQAISIGAGISQYKTVAFAERPPTPESNGHGESLGRIGMTRANGTNGHVGERPPTSSWRCYACGWEGRVHREQHGDWVCAGCTVIVGGPAPCEEVPA